jgi:hypothetical protein
MSKTILRYTSVAWILGAACAGWSAGCLDSGSTVQPSGQDASADGTTPQGAPDGASRDSSSNGDGGLSSDGAGGGDGSAAGYVLIDDMETTTNGPIQLGGIAPPLTPGYWFNFGADGEDAGDTTNPALMSFAFAALAAPTTTLNGKASSHVARQFCSLIAHQYDVCGLGFEFVQEPDPDAGMGSESGPGLAVDASSDAGDAGPRDATVDAADAAGRDAAADAADAADATVASGDGGAGDGGDAGPPMPKLTIPFDISQYKGITFWGRASGDAGALDIKVQFPDTDTDPRGLVCNNPNNPLSGASGFNDTKPCFNSYSTHLNFTSDWKEFTVLFTDLSIESFGYQSPGPFDGKMVYGINWQGQMNTLPDAGPVLIDFEVDDVYFVR